MEDHTYQQYQSKRSHVYYKYETSHHHYAQNESNCIAAPSEKEQQKARLELEVEQLVYGTVSGSFTTAL